MDELGWTVDEGREYAAALEWALMTPEERETIRDAIEHQDDTAEAQTPPQ